MSGSRGFRKCRRCQRRKPYTDFPRCRSSKRNRLSTVCRDCWAVSGRERSEWIANGRLCLRCDQVRPCPGEIGFAYNAVCKPCQRQHHAEYQRRRRSTPSGAEHHHAANKKWREQNPEAAREAQRRYREKVMADPKRAAEWRENQRIYHRIWRMRKGRSSRFLSDEQYRQGNGRMPARNGYDALPSRPLADAIERLITIKTGWFDEEPANSVGHREAVCERLGISPRNLWAWRTGERQSVQFLVADRALTRMGLNWWDVWNEDTTSAEDLERVFVAFDPEGIAA